MKHKVIALDTYSKRHIKDSVLGFIPEKDFEFEVDDERLDVLLGNNYYHVAFVKEVEKKAKEETVVEAEKEVKSEDVKEKASKKQSKKK